MLITTDCVRVPAILAVARLELTLRVYGSAGKIQQTEGLPKVGILNRAVDPIVPLLATGRRRCILVQGRSSNPGPGTSTPIAIFGKAVANHSQAASPLGEHSSVVLNYWLGKGRNYEKLSMHLMLTL